jgi:hypothetical protein
MKISCPKCGAVGNLPDHEIPEEGRFLSCPKCKNGFDVKKPRATTNEYLVDVCPACAYSTFGDERFGTCPKCGVMIKAFIDRQREEMARARDQELLTRKFSRDMAPPPPNVPSPSSQSYQSSPQTSTTASESINIGELIENLHPVNLIGWGCSLAAIVILLYGIIGLFGYFGSDIQAKLSEQREERVSALYVFIHYGLLPWILVLYGSALLAVSTFFLKHQAQSRKNLALLLWGFIAYVPAYHLVIIISHFFEPIRPSFGTFAFEFLLMIVVSALVGFPLYLLINFLEDKRVKSVVRL